LVVAEVNVALVTLSNSVNTQFYHDLKSFSDFAELTDDSHFQPVPAGWCIIITDVKGSTVAIEAGAYKDVNTVGAAAIVVVQNALKGMEFPYVFGGDGATILIPASYRQLVAEKLAALKNLSAQNFGLQLRVGIVDVSDITGDGVTTEVAKFELFAGKCVAVFRGGGLSLAEKLVKEQPDTYEIAETPSADVNLSGLSCRWNEIPNERGCVLSLLVLAKERRGKQVYPQVLEKLNQTFGSEFRDHNPVNPALMTYKSVNECRRDERRYHNGWSLAWLWRSVEILASVMMMRSKLPTPMLDPKKYGNMMRDHSDYRKFDDMLRMIIDCSVAQVDDVSRYLETAHQNGDLYYGLHQSDTSLMTCFVESVSDGNHIHFIDGGNGGYAMAAKQLKAQLKS
tara:strand:- start:7758 stop:8945 length:1188 start_codon:yes stop_codon:yes gene_type:complete